MYGSTLLKVHGIETSVLGYFTNESRLRSAARDEGEEKKRDGIRKGEKERTVEVRA